MKYLLPVIWMILFWSCVAKKLPAVLYNTPDYFILHKDIRIMEMDHLGNIYFIDGLDRLSKFDTTGHLTFNNVNNSLGHVHSVDVGNPFKIMIFYRDQQTIVLLDRTLSEINQIVLANWNLHDITAAALSPDNAIWLYDGTNRVLLKMDDHGKPILTSDPFDIISPPTVRPDFIYDINQYLLLKEAGKPIAVFDDFGNYIKAIADVTDNFTLSSHYLVYPKDGHVRVSDITGMEGMRTIRTQALIGNQKVFYSPGKFYFYDDKGIYFAPEEQK